MTSIIVRTASRIIIPFIFLFGIYTIAYGHLSPGGGFQGGVILAMGVVLIILAYDKRTLQRYRTHLSLIELIGVFAFILVGIAGLFLGASFFMGLGAIWVLNIVIGTKVCTGLVLLYMLFLRWGRARC